MSNTALFVTLVVVVVAYVIATVSGQARPTTVKRIKPPPPPPTAPTVASTTTAPPSVAIVTSTTVAAPLACAATAVDDVASRTVLASFVFEGRVLSNLNSSLAAGDDADAAAPSPSSPSTVDAVFSVTRVIKGDVNTSSSSSTSSAARTPRTPLLVLVGPFAVSSTPIIRSMTGDRCPFDRPPLVLPTTKGAGQQQQLYIVFAASRTAVQPQHHHHHHHHHQQQPSSLVDGTVQFRYRVSGAPIRATKQAVKDAQSHGCDNCAKRPSGVQLKSSAAKPINAGTKWHLECKGQGRPTPSFVWYKNGVEFSSASTKGAQIKNTKRGSKLMANKATESHSGSYSCRAVNVIGFAHSKPVNIIVQQAAAAAAASRTTTEPAEKSHSEPCSKQVFCLNGGTCYVFSNMRSQYCECPPTFIGRRCEEKRTPPEAKKSTESGSSDFPLGLDTFLIISLSAIAFTVLLATSIFVWCTLSSGLNMRSRFRMIPSCTDANEQKDHSIIHKSANGKALSEKYEDPQLLPPPRLPPSSDHRQTAATEKKTADKVRQNGVGGDGQRSLLQRESRCNSRGESGECREGELSPMKSTGSGARTSSNSPYDSDPDASVV